VAAKVTRTAHPDRQKAGGIVPTSLFRRKGKKAGASSPVFTAKIDGF
jgi:hypothetical protein